MSTIASRKSKGRKLQQYVRDLLLEKTKKYGLVSGDIESTPLGVSGVDLKLSPAAQKIIPFSVECKNQEKINLNSCLEQTENNSTEDRPGLLVIKKNRKKPYVVIEYSALKKILNNIEKIFNVIEENNKKFNIWSVINQAENIIKNDKIPLILFVKNQNKVYAVVELEKLLDLLY